MRTYPGATAAGARNSLPKSCGWAVLACLILLVTAAAAPADGGRAAVSLPPARPEIIAYNRFWYTFLFVDLAWDLVGLLLLVRMRFGPRLRAALERRYPRAWVRQALFYAAYALALTLWKLPPGFAGYLHERSYGFATQSIGLWIADHGRGFLFSLLTIPAVWAGYWLVRRSPKRWWLWLWAASIPWQFVMIVLGPVVIAPAYNDFRPLQDPVLRDRLLGLAERAGVRGARVYQVDISKRTTKLNAYVTGLGPSKRIVLWDTTLRNMTQDEIVAIMAHELGHYVLGHIWWRLGEGIVGAFALLWLLAKLYPWAVERWGKRYGVEGVLDLGGLPIFSLILSLLIVLQTPVESALSRMHEREADQYGLELNGDGVAMARAYVAFVRRDFADPDPPRFFVFWYYSHPPLKDRVAHALEYEGAHATGIPTGTP